MTLGPLISEADAIKKEIGRRSSPDIFRMITGKTKKLLDEKAALEEQEGWRVFKRNDRSYRMAHPKELDEQFEDEVWCILAKMGFTEYSEGRNFRIEVGKDVPSRQIDVFAKDDDVALIIECTQCDVPKQKSMGHLIEKLVAIKDPAYKAITAYYGREAQIKPRIVIATKNVTWAQADLAKCAENGIAVLAEDELEYYAKLTSHLHSAARFQFLAHIFGGTAVKGLALEVAATQGKMGGTKFYNFLIKPESLMKIAYVGHKASRTTDNLETYQRMLKPARLKEIAAYIEGGGKFPTNIVANIKTKGQLQFNKQKEIGDAAFGTLTLPNRYASAWIIDGQHRLYGYAYREMKRGGIKQDNSALPVLAFENLSAEDEMNMFIDINCEQVKVQKSLLVELYSDLHWNSEDPSQRLLALVARICSKLNSLKTSPVHDRVIVTGKTKTFERCLTQTSLSDGLSISRLLGVVTKNGPRPGPLGVANPDDLNGSLNKAVAVIVGVLDLFAKGIPGNWALGDQKGGYLCTNNAVRALFLVCADVCAHVEKESGIDSSILNAAEVLDELTEYFTPVVDYFKRATAAEFEAFRRQQALAGVKKQSLGMDAIVANVFPKFRPVGLEEYLKSRDRKGTDEATILINQTQMRIFNYTVRRLRDEFGVANDAWWTKGVPAAIRQACTTEWEKRDREKSSEAYLTLINYPEIAMQNWELLGQAFALDEKDSGNRKKCLAWLKKLKDIRNTTHHPEKGALDDEEIAFVNDIAERVSRHFPEPGT